MQSFSYRAFRPNGSTESGRIEADDRVEASRKLAQAGKLAFAIEAADTKDPRALGSRSPSTTLKRPQDLADLFSELAGLLAAGFSAEAALRITTDSERRKGRRDELNRVSSKLSNGSSVADAFGSLPTMPADVTALIAAGERSGRLGEVFARIASIHAQRAQRRSAMVEALIYPIFLLVLVMVAILFLAFTLVPALMPIFQEGGLELPLAIRTLAFVRASLIGHLPLVLSALVAAAAVVAWDRTRRPIARAIGTAALRFPKLGSFIRRRGAARYLGTLALLLGNGVPLPDALRLAADTVSQSEAHARLGAIRPKVIEGQRLYRALADTLLFDDAAIKLVRLGEESDSLAPLVQRASDLIEARSKKVLDRAMMVLTPAITIGLGVVVGSLVVSVMTALLSINELAVQ